MSLRRTALERKSELRRTPLQRKKPMNRARAVHAQVAKHRRDTGPTRVQRQLVVDRAMGCCEICGRRIFDRDDRPIAEYSIHHRRARGMGGRSGPEINSPANLLLLCGSGVTGCHGYVESHRAEAYTNGWLIRADHNPAHVPVLLEGNDLYLHDDHGNRREVTTEGDTQ